MDIEFDGLTKVALELVCLEMLILVERQGETQLPGGKYHNPSSTLKASASNVPKTNVVGERDMAILDNLLREKPGKLSHCLVCFLNIFF